MCKSNILQVIKYGRENERDYLSEQPTLVHDNWSQVVYEARYIIISRLSPP